MVGFPGETDAQFRRTVEVCRAAGFSRLHIFPFSPREGTPAARLPGACSSVEIAERRQALGQAADELQRAFEREWTDRQAQVLFEHKRDRGAGKLRGYTERYISVVADGADNLMGRIVPVRLTRSAGGYMEGVVVEA